VRSVAASVPGVEAGLLADPPVEFAATLESLAEPPSWVAP
jgi:hypothetical protein